jgi:6,7-dimethyl-8-ribityllumazine synthase
MGAHVPDNTKHISASLVATDLRIALVVARFNSFLVDQLQAGAIDAFLRHGGSDANITVVHVPGAFEIPLAARKLADSGKHHAVVCLGAVVRGATPHFDYVAGEAARGVTQASLATGVPCIFGVVTTDTLEQAIERCGTKAGNKGADATVAAIEMANLMRKLSEEA